MPIIKFEGLAPDGEIAAVPDGHRHLNWNNVYAVNGADFAGTGHNSVIHSGKASAYNNAGLSIAFRSADRADDFDLNSGYFATFISTDLKVKVVGFDDGERVAKKVFLLDPTQEFVTFAHKFDDIDEVRFKARGGTDDNPNDDQPLTDAFAVDDLFIDF